jgi:periplasmic protein TonB
MFAESLLESAATRGTRRGWTAASITVQAAVLSLFALVPLIYPDALSIIRPEQISIPLFTNAPAPVTHESPHPRANAAPTTDAPFVPVRDSAIHFGTATDHTVDPQPLPPSGFSIPGSNPPIATNGAGPRVVLENTPKPIALSHMEAGSLIHNVKPIYPRMAVETHTEGTVLLHAFISREGMIESLRVVSGHPLLAHAAVEAVRQWRYRPYVLNGEPLEVETQITVNFTLGKN